MQGEGVRKGGGERRGEEFVDEQTVNGQVMR
jgi:hypothetical protein